MLSKRLKEIANLVEKAKVVFDVGSDHALLPCFLVLNEISPKVYAGDIALGPLNNGIENIKRYGLIDRVIPILSDGLDKAPEDVETVIISGMGYFTIEHILDNCDLNRFDNIIIQSNTDIDKLRQYISDHNYTILDEKVVHDEFYYQIIKINTNYHEKYDDLQIKYGPVLLDKMDESYICYLKDYRERLAKINERANKKEYQKTINQIDKILYN